MTPLLLPRPGERLLPAVSGVLLALAYPPLHPLLLPFVGLVPVAVWLHRLPGDGDGAWAAARGGMVFGAAYFGLTLHWIFTALIRFSGWAAPAFAVVLLAGVILGGLFAWGVHRAVHGAGVPLWVGVPVMWTASEWLRGNLPGSLSFPWLGLGTSLTGFPELVGAAELVGARGVGFWIALVNGLLATALVRRGAGARVGRVAWAAALVATVPAAWGLWRAATLELRPAAPVAVVQPGIPQRVKQDRDAVVGATLAALDRLLARVEPGSVELVVLPETVFPLDPRAASAASVMDRVQGYAREVGAPVLFGGVAREPSGDGAADLRNSAFLMTPQGLAGFRYDKRRLVPGWERVPGVPAGVLRRLGSGPGFSPGDGWPLAEVGGVRAGVLICYESVYPELARTFRREGAELLVNITNDAWLGGEPWWSRTPGVWQHPAHLVMRAIENRVGVARAANTGISLFVDPVGRVSHATSFSGPDIRVAVVTTADVATLYTRYGDVTGLLSVVGALALLACAWRVARTNVEPNGARGRLDPMSGSH